MRAYLWAFLLTYYFSGTEALVEEAFSLFTGQMSAQYQLFADCIAAKRPVTRLPS